MIGYNPAEYGDSCAGFYEQLYPNIEPGLIGALTGLARGGPVLELGLATGRVARRLNDAGISTYGIEASLLMIDRCRSLPGAAGLHIVQGDFTAIPLAGRFKLIFTLVNTLSLLPSRDLLIGCLRDVARLLVDDGVFVYETYLVDQDESPVTHDYPIQTIDGLRNYRVTSLATSPEKLKEIAAASGLRFIDEWQDWQRTAVTAESMRRIIIFGPVS